MGFRRLALFSVWKVEAMQRPTSGGKKAVQRCTLCGGEPSQPHSSTESRARGAASMRCPLPHQDPLQLPLHLLPAEPHAPNSLIKHHLYSRYRCGPWGLTRDQETQNLVPGFDGSGGIRNAWTENFKASSWGKPHGKSDVSGNMWRKRGLAMWELCEEPSRQRGWSGQSLWVGMWLGVGRSLEQLNVAKDAEGRVRWSWIWTLIPYVKSLPAGNH